MTQYKNSNNVMYQISKTHLLVDDSCDVFSKYNLISTKSWETQAWFRVLQGHNIHGSLPCLTIDVIFV